MLRTIGLALVLAILVPAHISGAEKTYRTNEVLATFVKNKSLTEEQANALLGNSFLQFSCASIKSPNCRPSIDFASDCSLYVYEKDSKDEIFEDQIKELVEHNAALLLGSLDALRTRVEQYPKVIKAFGKWDGLAEQRLAELKRVYDAGVIIANKSISRVARLREARPILEKAAQISQDLALSAGFVYDGGCGAPPEDSQKIVFSFSEKPESAFYILQMNLDQCKHILDDPHDPSKCDFWERIGSKKIEVELSGNYRYRVTWADGSIVERPFKVLSTGRKTIEISK